MKNIQKKMIAALYVRVSKDEQVEGFSITAQINQLKEYCKRNDIEVYEIYADEGISGQKENREQFQRMIKDAAKKHFNIILVHKFDRFARKVELSQRIKRELRKSGVNVVSISEPIADSPIGFFQEGILELLAEYYVKNLAAEVKKGQAERAAAGLHNGRVTIGYKVEEGKMVVDEPKAKIVKQIFDMYVIQGKGRSGIARYLNEMGISAANGGKWTPQRVLGVLTSHKYIGMVRLNDKVYQGLHEPIIDNEIFNQAQDILKSKEGRYTYDSKNKDNFFLLGLLRCVCGKPVRVKHTTSKNRDGSKWEGYYYQCTGKHNSSNPTCTLKYNYRAEKLEEHITSRLQRIFEGVEVPDIKVTKRVNISDLIEDKKQRLEQRLLRLKAGYLDGLFAAEEFKKDKKAIEDELAEIDKMKQEPEDTVDIKKYRHYWEMFKDAKTAPEKRVILQRFLHYIELSEDKFYWHFYNN